MVTRLFVAVVLAGLVACVEKEDTSAPPLEDLVEEHELTWGYADVYDGDTLVVAGPDHWDEIVYTDGTVNECGGDEQSPIDATKELVSGAAPDGTTLTLAYASTSLKAANNGHTIVYLVDAGSTLQWNGASYTVKQFHFHASSEHLINGRPSPMELHIVHDDGAGNLAVLGVMIEGAPDVGRPNLFVSADAAEGADDGALKFHDALALPVTHEPEPEDYTDLGGTLDLGRWFDVLASVDLAHYRGSLTTPPCSEGVMWFLSGGMLAARDADIAAFEAVYSDNHRPVQPFGARDLTIVAAGNPR